MKTLDQTSSLFWLLVSISVLVESTRLGIGTLHDPGMGFLSFGMDSLPWRTLDARAFAFNDFECD